MQVRIQKLKLSPYFYENSKLLVLQNEFISLQSSRTLFKIESQQISERNNKLLLWVHILRVFWIYKTLSGVFIHIISHGDTIFE